MRFLISWTLVPVFLLAAVAVHADGGDAVIGKWLVEDKSGVIEIYKCGKKYCGKTIWIKPTPDAPDPSVKLDVHNPDPKKRTEKLLGKTTLWGLTFDPEDKEWEDGSIYNSRNGKVYRCRVTMDSQNKLKLRGYIGISLIGQTTVWTRKTP